MMIQVMMIQLCEMRWKASQRQKASKMARLLGSLSHHHKKIQFKPKNVVTSSFLYTLLVW